jgi:hypothetical protein
MKKFMFCCYMSSLFFTTSGCVTLYAAGAIDQDRAQQEEVIKVQRDVIECVRQSSEAGLGPDKPCPFTDPMSVFKWDFAFLHASKEYFAQKNAARV